MGLVYNQVGSWVKAYQERSVTLKEALVTPGQESVSVTAESLTAEEVNTLALKLDVMANDRQNPAIAAMVAKSFPTIVTAVQWVKDNSGQEFRGAKALGRQLDIAWLVPSDIGFTILRGSAAAGSLGIYDQTPVAAGTFKWLYSFTENTLATLIPTQSMKKEAACVHLGMIDTAPISAVNKIKFTLAGVAAPDQSLAFGHTDGSEMKLQEFEYPVVVGPERSQKIELYPYRTGSSKPELITLLVAMAEDLAMPTA